MIRAITLDLWDTVIHDDTDEPKRAAAGLAPKPAARRALMRDALATHCGVPAEIADTAYDVTDAAFNQVWHEQHVTWSVEERLSVLLGGLRRELPEAALADVVARIERMELEFMPDPVPGIGEAIETLAARYPLAVVSDAIHAPGRHLREWLERHHLLHHFRVFAFSDEVGRAKPHPDIFHHAARGLGLEASEMLHIGDREHNDVRGPHALGMKAILFIATRDRDRTGSTADAICERAADLPDAVARLVDTGR
ncbi:MAG: HAD family hydrolase [Chromatiales bacterium]|nr:HAD family hydrolase [Chromatiales bacterium]